MAKILISIINFYQMLLSPLLGNRCCFYPCCSWYIKEAITRHGAIKGLILGSSRLARCNPLSDCDVDHVPEQFTLFKKQTTTEVNQ